MLCVSCTPKSPKQCRVATRSAYRALSPDTLCSRAPRPVRRVHGVRRAGPRRVPTCAGGRQRSKRSARTSRESLGDTTSSPDLHHSYPLRRQVPSRQGGQQDGGEDVRTPPWDCQVHLRKWLRTNVALNCTKARGPPGLRFGASGAAFPSIPTEGNLSSYTLALRDLETLGRERKDHANPEPWSSAVLGKGHQETRTCGKGGGPRAPGWPRSFIRKRLHRGRGGSPRPQTLSLRRAGTRGFDASPSCCLCL